MWLNFWIVVVCLNFSCFVLEITASSNSQELAQLPNLFYLNETEKCPDDHFYCKVDVKLKPKNEDKPPELWKLIEKQSVYKRDIIYRALCIGSESIEEKLEHELSEFNLTGDIDKSYCYKKQKFTDAFGSIDIFIWLVIMTYLGFIIFSTIKTYNPKYEANKYQQMFSLINTWKEINAPRENEDFKNLLCFQGMRTLAMSLIVANHSILTSMCIMFLKNPEYYDDVPDHLVQSILHGSIALVVQIYFIISAWLLSVQLHNIVRKTGEFTMKDLLILWLNRYFRLFPAIACTLLLYNSESIAASNAHPYFYSIVQPEVARCKVIWWKNLLFLQNINMEDDGICAEGMWYVAVDFHMYIISSTFFYISRRFKISMKYLFGLLAIGVASIQIYTVLTTDFDGVLRFSPRLLPVETAFQRPDVFMSYIPTYCSAGTYIIGYVFGTFYSHNKNKIIFDTSMKKFLGYAAFFGIPITISYLLGFRPNRVLEAFFAVSFRPLFAFGVAVGLLVMVNGSGDLIKMFFECSPMVFLGNFTYSTYMFHFFVVFGRAVSRATYVELSDLYCFSMWILDLVSSFTLGMVMYIILEHPCLTLQKNLFLQLRMGKRKEVY